MQYVYTCTTKNPVEAGITGNIKRYLRIRGYNPSTSVIIENPIKRFLLYVDNELDDDTFNLIDNMPRIESFVKGEPID